jgi:hypothetical protein
MNTAAVAAAAVHRHGMNQCGIRKIAATLAIASAAKNPMTAASAFCMGPPRRLRLYYRSLRASRFDHFQKNVETV